MLSITIISSVLLCFFNHRPSVISGNKQAVTALFSAASISTAQLTVISYELSQRHGQTVGGRVSKRGCPISLAFVSCLCPPLINGKNLYLRNFVDDGNDVCEWDRMCCVIFKSVLITSHNPSGHGTMRSGKCTAVIGCNLSSDDLALSMGPVGKK